MLLGSNGRSGECESTNSCKVCRFRLSTQREMLPPVVRPHEGPPPLAPVASYEGLIVAANLLKGNHLRPNYLGIPSVVFTIPSLAAVGLSERGAREQNLKFRVKKEMTSTWYSSRRIAETYSGYKVLVEEGTDRILGAHILGSEADEVINLFALAIRSGMRATDWKHMLFAYPTSGSNMARML